MKVAVGDSHLLTRLEQQESLVGTDVDLLSCLPDSVDVEHVISRADVFVGSVLTPDMARSATSLRFVLVAGAGVDGIATDCLDPSVAVANTYCHERSIGEYVLMVMIALSRSLLQCDRDLRQGVWRSPLFGQRTPLPPTLRGKVLGLIGLGRIGTEVARLAGPLGMQVVGTSRTRNSPSSSPSTNVDQVVALPALLSLSDFVVVACPLDESTRDLLGAEELAAMKRSAFVVNVSRGGVVNETDLYDALATGTIAGAGIDVWYQYPDDGPEKRPGRLPFEQFPNVIMTPHISGATQETYDSRASEITQNVLRILDGKPVRNIVAHGTLAQVSR